MSILKPLRAPSCAIAAMLILTALTDSSLAQQAPPPATPPASAPAPVPQAPAPAPSAAPKPVSLKVKLTSLEEWDTQIDALVRLSYQVYGSQGGQDLGGHDLQYYWQQHVFTPATKENLEMLRDKAQKQSVAKDTAGLQKTLDEASAILTTEHAKAYIISLFLSAQDPVVYHQYQLGPWLARAGDADRQGINDRVTSTYEVLAKELDQALKQPDIEKLGATSQSFLAHLSEPLAFFNAERARLVKAQAELPNPVAVAALTRDKEPCPAPVQPTKGRDKPGLGADFPSSEAFYPATAKLNDVEGSVTLRATISETGCIQRAEVVGTSGVAELDEGALKLAMAGKYVPAAGPGDKGVAGSMMFRIKFEQPDPFHSAK
jgi:TonB family protein